MDAVCNKEKAMVENELRALAASNKHSHNNHGAFSYKPKQSTDILDVNDRYYCKHFSNNAINKVCETRLHVIYCCVCAADTHRSAFNIYIMDGLAIL
eukprot:COSAG01_NODE_1395_length_10476_cov_11.562331_5_plen_97_part_00